MDKNSNFLDEIAEAAEREKGDAKKAWKLLAAAIDETDLPTWVKNYVKRSAAVVADYDIEAGDQALLAHMLGFYKEKEVPPSKAVYHPDEVFEWFTDRITRDVENGKKPNVSRTAREYLDEKKLLTGSPDAVRKTYEKARARFEAQMRDEIEFQRLLAER